MSTREDAHPSQPSRHRQKGYRAKIRDRIRRNWRNSLRSAGGSDKVRKKVLTVLLYFILCAVMAAVFVGSEYQNDRQNRIKYKLNVHEHVKEISQLSKIMDVVEWRYYAKSKIDQIVKMNHELNIGPNPRVEAWNYANAFVFILSTTTTIGYGYPAPNTTTGRIITIILCITGIPFAYMALTDFVDLILVLEKFLWLMVKKKGSKPLSTIAIYRDIVTSRLTQMISLDKLCKEKSLETTSAPEMGRSQPQSREHLTIVTKPSPLHSQHLSTHSKQEQPHTSGGNRITPAEPLRKGSVKSEDKYIYASEQTMAPVEENETATDPADPKSATDLQDTKPKQLTTVASRQNLSCPGKLFACIYENCCEDLAIEEEQEDEEYHVEDHLRESHPERLPCDDTLQHMKLKTGTVRRSVDLQEDIDIGRQSDHVVDGHVHSETGRPRKRSVTSGDTIHSIQTTIRKEFESSKTGKDAKGPMEGKQNGERTVEQRGKRVSLATELKLPKSVMQNPSKVCGPTLRYSVDQYGNLDERIQQHRKEQKQLQVAQRHERRLTLMQTQRMEAQAEEKQHERWEQESLRTQDSLQHDSLHQQSSSQHESTSLQTQDSDEQPQESEWETRVEYRQMSVIVPPAPPQSNDGMAFTRTVAESGALPTHDHNLCNDLLANTMTSLLDAITAKIKAEIDAREKARGEERTCPEELQKETKDRIAFELDNINKEVSRYMIQHEQDEAQRQLQGGGAVAGTADQQRDSGTRVILVSDESDASEDDTTPLNKQNPENGNKSNSCAVTVDDNDESYNTNRNAANAAAGQARNYVRTPMPKVVRTQSRSSGTNSHYQVTLSSLTEDDEDDDREEVSLAITFLNLLLYIFVGALIYKYQEHWDYLTCVYYIFTSISTIGFGDVMPTSGTTLFFWSSLFIFFGLAFLAKVITGIRGAMMKFMVKTVDTVERAGLKIISNVSHLSKNMNATVKPHQGESATEIHLRTHDITDNALVIPTTSKARQMMRVNSLPSNLSNYIPNSPHSHDYAAKLTPAQLGTQPLGAQTLGTQALGPQALGTQALGPQALGPQALGTQALGPQALHPVPSTSAEKDGGKQTDNVTVVASGSKVDPDDATPPENARLLMTPRATDDRSVGSVSIDTVDPNMPLSPPPEDPSLKQRRMSLLMNSEYVTEELSKNPGSFEVLDESGRKASKADESKPRDPSGAGNPNELAPIEQVQFKTRKSSK